MKKFLGIIVLLITLVILGGCDRRPALYVLHWGEYIDEELVAQFEDEFNVRVVIDPAESNEAMYTKIHSQTTSYDVAVPSDYMIHKLYKEDLLYELDFDKIPNYSEANFDENLEALRDEYFAGNQDYAVPYFWGTLGIMYNERKAGIKELVEEHEWEVFFNQEVTNDAKIGMYNSSRDAIAVAQMYLDIDFNSTDQSDLDAAEEILKKQSYFTWGTDNLKQMIAEGNADIALVYSGDFFDMLYATLEDEAEVTYNMHVPDKNNVWFDAMVIPKTAKNIDLAHEFINFMIDADNALQNAFAIGYAPTLTSAYLAMQEDEEYAELIATYPFYPGDVDEGEVYLDLGPSVYNKMEIILSNVKG